MLYSVAQIQAGVRAMTFDPRNLKFVRQKRKYSRLKLSQILQGLYPHPFRLREGQWVECVDVLTNDPAEAPVQFITKLVHLAELYPKILDWNLLHAVTDALKFPIALLLLDHAKLQEAWRYAKKPWRYPSPSPMLLFDGVGLDEF